MEWFSAVCDWVGAAHASPLGQQINYWIGVSVSSAATLASALGLVLALHRVGRRVLPRRSRDPITEAILNDLEGGAHAALHQSKGDHPAEALEVANRVRIWLRTGEMLLYTRTGTGEVTERIDHKLSRRDRRRILRAAWRRREAIRQQDERAERELILERLGRRMRA